MATECSTGTVKTKLQPTEVRTIPLAVLTARDLTKSPVNTCSENFPCMIMSVIIHFYCRVSLHIGVFTGMETIFKLPWKYIYIYIKAMGSA
jgi:hypothetical protein